jgi:hypothetical protein
VDCILLLSLSSLHLPLACLSTLHLRSQAAPALLLLSISPTTACLPAPVSSPSRSRSQQQQHRQPAPRPHPLWPLPLDVAEAGIDRWSSVPFFPQQRNAPTAHCLATALRHSLGLRLTFLSSTSLHPQRLSVYASLTPLHRLYPLHLLIHTPAPITAGLPLSWILEASPLPRNRTRPKWLSIVSIRRANS